VICEKLFLGFLHGKTIGKHWSRLSHRSSVLQIYVEFEKAKKQIFSFLCHAGKLVGAEVYPWVDPSARMDIMEMRKISCPYRDLNPGSSSP